MWFTDPNSNDLEIEHKVNITLFINESLTYLSSKCSQEVLDHAIKFPTDALKTVSKEALQKTAEATGDLIDNTITTKITNVSRNSEQNSLETVTINNPKHRSRRCTLK